MPGVAVGSVPVEVAVGDAANIGVVDGDGAGEGVGVAGTGVGVGKPMKTITKSRFMEPLV
ncbi:MAG: hypothetical protein O2854_00260 [Chloroflexi bacterium]|nr:hypothetical protein [Chloroflexota bacterium]